MCSRAVAYGSQNNRVESVLLLPLPGLQGSNSKSSGFYSKCIYTLSHLTGPNITHFESSFSLPTNVTSENRICFAFSYLSGHLLLHLFAKCTYALVTF